MAKKRNAPALKNNLRNEPAEKFRTVNRMNGIVTMVEYTSEDDIKAYELEPTFRELTGGGGGSDLSIANVTFINNLSAMWFMVPCVSMYDDSASSVYVNTGTSNLEIILYNNSTTATLEWPGDQPNISTTGDVTFEDGLFTITGDGTITVS